MNSSVTQLEQLHLLTKTHRATHNCGAYTFNDGEGLRQIAHQYQPKRILELGCALGYTAACMAIGAPNALVDTIECDASHVKLAREQLSFLNLSQRVRVHQGYFETVLPQLTEAYDMVFFDGFEPSMSLLIQLHDVLVQGGVLVCANIGLAHGQEAKALLAEFKNNKHWQTEFNLENGKTLTAIKVRK